MVERIRVKPIDRMVVECSSPAKRERHHMGR
jgi:hypothetical protein